MRSLKQPGRAFTNLPLLGSDPQVGHMRDLYHGRDDFGGVHINMGIPNRAFFEAANRIGTDKAASIWIAALANLRPASTFEDAAAATIAVAAKNAGKDGAEAVALRSAWEAVGIVIP